MKRCTGNVFYHTRALYLLKKIFLPATVSTPPIRTRGGNINKKGLDSLFSLFMFLVTDSGRKVACSVYFHETVHYSEIWPSGLGENNSQIGCGDNNDKKLSW
ncbi:hypothetical protein C0J52_17140 [Blattella germanica]|nr:hypothetical protein C0J52_17140 [Blattella germanica]